jgi:phage tail sheath gpL-like
MPISFNTIPINLRLPGAWIEIINSQALTGLTAMPSRLLVWGQVLGGGSAPVNAPILVPTGGSPDAMFGVGSMLSQMCKFIKAANPWTELWAMPLSDSVGGTASVYTITAAGSPTQNATQNFYVNGVQVQVALTAGMTAAQAAAALQAAIAAILVPQPLAATVAGAVVTITASHKGLDAGNFIALLPLLYQSDVNVPGITFTVAQTTPGAGNPALTTALANLGNLWFTDWAMPYTDATSLAAIDAAVESLWGPMAMHDARVYGAVSGTVGTLAAYCSTNSLDEKLLTIMGTNAPPQPPYLWAAVYAAVGAYYLAIDPARQIASLALPGIIAPPPAQRFVPTDRNTLLYDGIATYTVDDGGNVNIEREITTYRTNSAGVTDPSYLDLTTLADVAYLRFSERARILQKFPRYKLADDGTLFDAGQAIVTPSIIATEIVALFDEWQAAGLVQNADAFKAGLLVQRDPNDRNTVNSMLPPNIVQNFRTFKSQIAFVI